MRNLAVIALPALFTVSACSSKSSSSSSDSTSRPADTATATAKSSSSAKAAVTSKALASATATATAEAEAPAVAVSANAPTATANAAESAASAEPLAEGTHHFGKGVLVGVPTTRSKVPSPQEWGAQSDIKDIPGNTGDLSDCEVRAVREWLRVSCRPFGGQDTGTALPRVEATGIEVTEGKNEQDVYTFASGGIASLVVPLLDGKRYAATVEYDAYEAKHITIDWPHGAPGVTVTFSK